MLPAATIHQPARMARAGQTGGDHAIGDRSGNRESPGETDVIFVEPLTDIQMQTQGRD